MRLPRLHVAGALAGMLGLAACQGDRSPTTPSTQSGDPSFSAAAAPATTRARKYIVIFKGQTVPADFAGRVSALGGKVVKSYPAVGAAFVSGLSTASAAQLAALSGVQSVELDVVVPSDRPLVLAGADESARPSIGPQANQPQSAFIYARQWNLRQINAPRAWAAGRLGSPNVTVAVLDGGVDYTHPDLAGRVDLNRSKSFLDDEIEFIQANFPGVNPIADFHYHGTHVASTISSNAVVAAGVTSGLTLIAEKVCYNFDFDGDGEIDGCPFTAIFDGLFYAIDQRADVVNMSLGGLFLKREESGRGGVGPSLVGLLNRLMLVAQRAGVTVVVAAGNEAADLSHASNVYGVFCDSPNVICVSATGPTAASAIVIDAQHPGGFYPSLTSIDAPARYTNFGNSINVAAPGGAAAPVWAACSSFTLDPLLGVCHGSPWRLGLNGTSMATPHVSALAALLVEDLGRRPQQIRSRIQKTADDLGKPGQDPFYGSGRINVARALGL